MSLLHTGTRLWRHQAVPVVALTALALALRWILLGDKSLWIDEAFTAWLVDQPLPAILRELVRIDQHPPLYYTLEHLLGSTADEAGLRGLSAVLGAATVPLLHGIGRAAAGRGTGLLAAGLFAVSPLHVAYGQQARMYTLLTFTAAAALCCLARLGRERRRPARVLLWTGYALAVAATMLSHNVGVFLPVSVLAATGAFQVWSRLSRPSRTADETVALGLSTRPVVGATLAGVLLWTPWLPVFLTQSARVDAEFWLPPPTLEKVVEHVRDLGSARASGLLLYPLAVVFVLLAALGARHVARRAPLLAWLLVGVAAGPLACALLVSVRRPIFYSQTLIWTAAPMLVLVAAGIVALRLRAAIVAVSGALVVLNAVSLVDYYRDPGIEQWRDATAAVAAAAAPGDLVLFDAGWARLPFEQYYRRMAGPRIEIHGVPAELFERDVLEPKVAVADLARVDALVAGRPRVWVVYSHDWYVDPGALIEQRLAARMRVAGMREFRAVRVIEYHPR